MSRQSSPCRTRHPTGNPAWPVAEWAMGSWGGRGTGRMAAGNEGGAASAQSLRMKRRGSGPHEGSISESQKWGHFNVGPPGVDSETRIQVVPGTWDRARGSEAGQGGQQAEHLHRLVTTVGSKGSAPLGRVRGPVSGSRVEGEGAGAFMSHCWWLMGGCLPCVAWRAPVTRESLQTKSFFNGGADGRCRWK